jgi:hypothetical protein
MSMLTAQPFRLVECKSVHGGGDFVRGGQRRSRGRHRRQPLLEAPSVGSSHDPTAGFRRAERSLAGTADGARNVRVMKSARERPA